MGAISIPVGFTFQGVSSHVQDRSGCADRFHRPINELEAPCASCCMSVQLHGPTQKDDTLQAQRTGTNRTVFLPVPRDVSASQI